LGITYQTLDTVSWIGNDFTARHGTNVIHGALQVSPDGFPESIKVGLEDKREYLIKYAYESAAIQRLLPSKILVYGSKATQQGFRGTQQLLYEMHGIVEFTSLEAAEPLPDVTRNDDFVLNGRHSFIYTNDGRYLRQANGTLEPVGVVYSSPSSISKRKVFVAIMMFLALGAPALWLLLKRAESRQKHKNQMHIKDTYEKSG
jgi:hypothetical protein